MSSPPDPSRRARALSGSAVSHRGARSERSPALLVLGHVTRDLFGSEARLGGAASYAARAAILLGVDTALVTVAPPGAPELEVLRSTPGLRLHVASSEVMTTFAIEDLDGGRRLSLLERARSLCLSDVPEAWRSPRWVYAGPIAAELDAALVGALGGSYVMSCVQGWLRDPTPGGPVRPAEQDSVRAPPQNLQAACFSRDDHPRAEAIAAHLTSLGVVVALTDGRDGARVSWGERSVSVPAAPAREVDPTGAGDVFALVFGLSLAAGHDPPEAARRAALAAARVVEGPGLGRLDTLRAELSS